MLAPLSRRHGDARVIAWMDANKTQLYLPTVALAEIISGVAKLRRLGRQRDAEALDGWIAATLQTFLKRVEVLDTSAAHETGVIMDRARALGQAPGFADAAIAGIALSRGMTLLTRNQRHFAPLGISTLDPFTTLPE